MVSEWVQIQIQIQMFIVPNKIHTFIWVGNTINLVQNRWRQREERNSCVSKNIKWIKSGTRQVVLDLSWDCTKPTGDSKETNNVQYQC
jgi:NADPH:quinone reductase-like Zn-dependent oxidoreductase